ncbi:MAG: hypothetical protein ACE5I1_12425, partial [bacterium]
KPSNSFGGGERATFQVKEHHLPDSATTESGRMNRIIVGLPGQQTRQAELKQRGGKVSYYIEIPAVGKKVPMRIYVQGIKQAIANPDKGFKHGLTCWWSCTGQEIREQFLESIHDRINTKGKTSTKREGK